MKTTIRKWRSMSGSDYLLFITLLLLGFFFFRSFLGDDRLPFADEYSRCIADKLKELQDGDIWNKSFRAVDECKTIYLQNVAQIKEYYNNDEFKYSFDPIGDEKLTDCNVITLGIGHDTTVETKLKKTYYSECNFYAADPIATKNEELYKPIGKYFPFAVGNETKKEVANVKEDPTSLQYMQKVFEHVELVEFLRDHVKLPKGSVIDHLLMDVEYAEYGMLDYFYKDSKLVEAGYTVCQWNFECHPPDDEQRKQFGAFLRRMAEEGRFLPIFHSNIGWWGRFYFLNVEDGRCLERYVYGQLF